MRLLRALRAVATRDQDGQAMVEAAMVLPILVFITFGVLVFGIFVNTKLAVSGAAREAARNYAIHGDSSRALGVARDYLRGTLISGTQGLTCSLGSSGSAPCEVVIDDSGGEYISVRVTFRQPSFVGGLFGLPDKVPLSATAVFRKEQ